MLKKEEIRMIEEGDPLFGETSSEDECSRVLHKRKKMNHSRDSNQSYDSETNRRWYAFETKNEGNLKHYTLYEAQWDHEDATDVAQTQLNIKKKDFNGMFNLSFVYYMECPPPNFIIYNKHYDEFVLQKCKYSKEPFVLTFNKIRKKE